MNELNIQYEAFAAESRALRDLQTEKTFVYQLISGEQREMKVGNIVHFYYPNQLYQLLLRQFYDIFLQLVNHIHQPLNGSKQHDLF